MAFFFKIEEMTHSDYAEKHNIDNFPYHDIIVENLECLMDVLDMVRAHVDSPVHVNSGYRCFAVNSAVGGQVNSRHLDGCAADISFKGPALMDKAYKFLDKNRKVFDIVELIRYPSFIHVAINC